MLKIGGFTLHTIMHVSGDVCELSLLLKVINFIELIIIILNHNCFDPFDYFYMIMYNFTM